MIYMFLAEGFEEIEALTVVDILRRAEIDIELVSLNSSKTVKGAHDIVVKADGLTEGMTVISEPESYLQYVGQTVTIGTGGNAGTLEAMRQEMMGGS